MQDISQSEGRTVLFVSHNMASVKTLCTKAIVLEHGKVVFEGQTDEAVSYYLKGGTSLDNQKQFGDAYDTSIFKLHQISVNNVTKHADAPIVEDQDIVISTDLSMKSKHPENYHITYHLYNELGDAMFSFSHAKSKLFLVQGHNRLTCTIPKSFLQSGQYFLSFFMIEGKRKAIFLEKDILSFTVVDAQREIGTYMGREPGYIRPQFKWEITQ
jgi:lipopolysaccharide transport system ATP-binding protein